MFEQDGDAFVPAPETRSPWGPDSLHGGAPVALMVRAVEQHVPDPVLRIVRVTADLVRPVPVAPLRITVETLRPGRRVSLVGAQLLAADDVCIRMTALLLREADVPLPSQPPSESERVPVLQPDDCPAADLQWPFVAFHTVGCDVRFARGAWLERGPAFAWIRLRHPVVAGEEPSPVQRAVAAADFANGVSAVLPWDEWLFVNPDLNVHVDRVPQGDWIGLDAATLMTDRGSGASYTTLYDGHSRVGRSVQSLLVEPLG